MVIGVRGILLFRCRASCGWVQGSRTDGSRLNHVADGEPLDSLVLGDAASAVGAAHGLDVAAAVLVTAAINQSAPSPYSM